MSEEGKPSLVATASKKRLKTLLRKPTHSDGSALWELVRSTGTLDLNSAYSYMLLGRFFADTCVVAEDATHGIVGFVSAFQPPRSPDTLFVWQIGVAEAQRGQGLAKSMLHSLLSRPALRSLRYIIATISPSNHASQALFRSLARDLSADWTMTEEDGLPAHLFPSGSGHEAESLFRIGPFRLTSSSSPYI